MNTLKKVLFVNANAEILGLAQIFFRHLGENEWSMTACSDLNQLDSRIKSQEHFDVAFVDVGMLESASATFKKPLAEIFTKLNEALTNRSGARMVLISAHVQDEAREIANRIGIPIYDSLNDLTERNRTYFDIAKEIVEGRPMSSRERVTNI